MDAGQEGAQRTDPAVEGDERLGIARLGPLPELDRRPDRVAPQREARPVGGRGEGHYLRLDGAKAVRAEPEVTDDVATETFHAVGCNRRAYTGRDLLGGQETARPASSLEQLFFNRPVPGWARYRTPLRNLWMCGAATHPGGGIMGASGRLAALQVLRAKKAA